MQDEERDREYFLYSLHYYHPMLLINISVTKKKSPDDRLVISQTSLT